MELNEYVTPEEIVKIQERMRLNDTKFARAVGAKAGGSVRNWKNGIGQPTGQRYEALKSLKRKFLSNGASSNPVVDVPQKENPMKKSARWQRIGELVDTLMSLSPEDREAVLKLIKE